MVFVKLFQIRRAEIAHFLMKIYKSKDIFFLMTFNCSAELNKNTIYTRKQHCNPTPTPNIKYKISFVNLILCSQLPFILSNGDKQHRTDYCWWDIVSNLHRFYCNIVALGCTRIQRFWKPVSLISFSLCLLCNTHYMECNGWSKSWVNFSLFTFWSNKSWLNEMSTKILPTYSPLQYGHTTRNGWAQLSNKLWAEDVRVFTSH